MISTEERERLRLASKVPEVTIYFWIIKVLATTVGETAADLLSIRLDLGLTVTSYVMGAVFVAALVLQVRAERYQPPLYWITVVLISIVGTLVSDNLVDGMGISLVTTSVAFGDHPRRRLRALVPLRGDALDPLDRHEAPRAVLLGAILFTFALGTSVGDLLAEGLDLGYGQAVLVFAAMIAAVALLYYVLGTERDPLVLGGLHPDAAARGLGGRLAGEAGHRRRAGPGHRHDERRLPRRHLRGRRLPDGQQGRPHRAGGSQVLTAPDPPLHRPHEPERSRR